MRKPIALASLLVLAACGRTPFAPAPASAPVTAIAPAPELASAPAPAPAIEGTVSASRAGDFVVYRFSGAYRKAPLTLTQRVVAPDVIDMTFDDGAKKTTARVHFDHTKGARREIAKVEPMSMDAFEALVAQTILAPDRNEATLGTEKVKLAVGGNELACDKTSWRVVVGKRSAILSTLTSDSFAWGDVGGEIRSEDGKLLYKVEVMSVGHDDP